MKFKLHVLALSDIKRGNWRREAVVSLNRREAAQRLMGTASIIPQDWRQRRRDKKEKIRKRRLRTP